MRHEVFISYAGEDLDTAWTIYNHLKEHNIEPWFAPVAIGPGDNWADRLEEGVEACAVILLLGTKHSADSTYVGKELIRAVEKNLSIISLKLDGAELLKGNKFLTTGIQFITVSSVLNEDELGRIRSAVRSNLAEQGVAPYPLDRLFQELIRPANGDLGIYLDAIRVLIRFVALLHAARYVHHHDFSPELNEAVEGLLSSRSLFVDLEIAHTIKAGLDEMGAGITPAFDDFFKTWLRIEGVSHYLEVSKQDADTFDREHLDSLLESIDPSAPRRPNGMGTNQCEIARKFLREAMGQEWLECCRFRASVPDDSRSSEPRNIPKISRRNLVCLTDEDCVNARVWLRAPSGEGGFPLDPFFTLVRTPGRAECDIGLLRGQAGHDAQFTPLTTEKGAPIERPWVVLPWQTLEVTRELPKEIFEGELHSVALHFLNNCRESVEIQEVTEILPENLLSAAGEKRVIVTGSFLLEPAVRQTVEYQVRGYALPEASQGSARRYPGNQCVAYSLRAEAGESSIRGDDEITVKGLPGPMVTVERRVLDGSRAPVTGEGVPLDCRLTVQVTIRSAGAAVGAVRLEEIVEGGRMTKGPAVLYEGAFGRKDLQAPIEATYELHVTGRDKLTIRHRATSSGAEITAADSGCVFNIQDRPEPRIELCWRDVVRGPANENVHELKAMLVVSNTGGTTAYGLAVRHTGIAGVDIITGNGAGSQFDLPSGEKSLPVKLPVKITFRGMPSPTSRIRGVRQS